MLPTVFNFDHAALSRVARGEEPKCIIVDCHKPGQLICGEHLCEYGLVSLHRARLWILAYQYYEKGVRFRVFRDVVDLVKYHMPGALSDIANLVKTIQEHQPGMDENLIRDIARCFAGETDAQN
ncbi:MAG: hypothetical protein V1867_01775 [Candidatus Falkowbacteria bacterium]